MKDNSKPKKNTYDYRNKWYSDDENRVNSTLSKYNVEDERPYDDHSLTNRAMSELVDKSDEERFIAIERLLWNTKEIIENDLHTSEARDVVFALEHLRILRNNKTK